MTTKSKSIIIIGLFSTAAAAWSGATALIPIAGPVLADTAGLTAISIAMAYSLSALYKKSLDTATLVSFSTVVLGTIFGTLALKAGASLIPLFGSWFNAATTATLHAAIGWAICKIYDDGKDLHNVSRKDLKRYIKDSKVEAEEQLLNYRQIYDNLSPEQQIEVKLLQKQIENKDISIDERTEINKRIEAIFGM
jgi:uncharacterized protein (DUF697 family)